MKAIHSGVITRVEGKKRIYQLGKTEAILPPTEQIGTETYHEGDRIKCYIVEVKKTTKRPSNYDFPYSSRPIKNACLN